MGWNTRRGFLSISLALKQQESQGIKVLMPCGRSCQGRISIFRWENFHLMPCHWISLSFRCVLKDARCAGGDNGVNLHQVRCVMSAIP